MMRARHVLSAAAAAVALSACFANATVNTSNVTPGCGPDGSKYGAYADGCCNGGTMYSEVDKGRVCCSPSPTPGAIGACN